MTFAETISSPETATQPSNDALLGIVLAVLAVIAVIIVGFLLFIWHARRSPSQTKSSKKVDKEVEHDEDPT
jgi:cell division protein FtsN